MDGNPGESGGFRAKAGAFALVEGICAPAGRHGVLRRASSAITTGMTKVRKMMRET